MLTYTVHLTATNTTAMRCTDASAAACAQQLLTERGIMSVVKVSFVVSL